MNKFSMFIAAGFALAASVTAASAEGLYVSGQLGFSGGGGEYGNTGADLVLDMGQVGSLAVGNDFGNIRVEGEIAFRQNNFDHITGVPVDGEMSSLALMANAYYEFGDNGWFFRPYLGAGLGAANVTHTSVFFGTDDEDTTFALQLMLGGSIPFTDYFAMTVDWRLFGAVPSFVTKFGTPFDQGYGISSVMLGARYTF